LIVQLAVGLCFISLPATVIGISFPMLGGLAAHRRADLGESIGYVYGANTMGCVAGSLLAGLVAVPLISSYKSFLIVVLLSVLTGACALLGARTFSWKKQLVFAGLPVLACAFLVGGLNNPLPRLLASVGGNKLLASGEDVTGLVTVFERAGQRDLNINGVCYASTVMSGKRYMRMLGHLPMFLKEHPNEVLNICFGTGTTAGAISTHPDLHRLDIVELSPLVLADAGFFSLANNNVLDDSRAVAQVNDGRNFLLLSNKKYDVITFEPPPPCEAGVVNLYTTNFYALARRHLKPGGILCQWVPMHLQSSTLWKMMIKSADKEFRQVSVWDSGDGEAVIICSDQSLSFDLVRLQQKIDSSTALRFNLQEVGFERASSLVATLLLSPEEVTSLVAGYQPVTDDSPALEFFLPYIGPTMKAYELSGSRLNWRSMMTAGTFTAACVEELEAQHQALEHARKAGTADLTEPMRRELLTRSLELCPNNRYYSWLWSRISASPRVAAP
jgi:spermidine synthase